jgi:hypothetical protein
VINRLVKAYASNSFLPFFFLGMAAVSVLSVMSSSPGRWLLSIGLYVAAAAVALIAITRLLLWLFLNEAFMKIRGGGFSNLSAVDLSSEPKSIVWALVAQAFALSCVGVAYGWLLMAILLKLPV